MVNKRTLGAAAARPTRRPCAWIALLLAACSLGCSGPTLGDVEGVVTLEGKPMGNVLVTFSPDPAKGTTGPRSSAVTNDQGRFVLRCETGQAGAIVGWHRVSVEDLQVYQLSRDGQGSSAAEIAKVQRVPAAYAHANQSPLLQEVRAGQQPSLVELRVQVK